MDGFQQKIVSRALDNPDVLTEWEYIFINSIADRDRPLTERQEAVLNRILKKLDEAL